MSLSIGKRGAGRAAARGRSSPPNGYTFGRHSGRDFSRCQAVRSRRERNLSFGHAIKPVALTAVFSGIAQTGSEDISRGATPWPVQVERG